MVNRVDKQQSPRTRRGRQKSVKRGVNTLFLGLALSVVASLATRTVVMKSELQRFDDRMDRLTRRLEHDTLMPLEIVHGLAGLFDASDEVTRAEFHAFAEPALERHPNVSALLWVPRVPRDELPDLKQNVRVDVPEFAIHDGVGAASVPSPEREQYFPIVFMAPERAEVLGTDLGADPRVAVWVDQAADAGMFITPRVEVPTRSGSEPAVVAMVAVHGPTATRRSGAPRGVVLASFRMAQLVSEVFANGELGSTQLMIFDGDKGELVYSTAGTRVETAPNQGHFERPVVIGNRTWLVVFQGTERLGTTLPVAVMVTGTLLSVALAIMLWLLTRLRAAGPDNEQLGQYELLEVLGQGGMGTVYRARHVLLRRPTAVKVIRTEAASRGSLRERFEREVHAASQLSHPNNIVVYDYGQTPDDELYYAMEFVDGIDLHRLVERFGPMPSHRVANMLAQVSGALAEAHARGIVHRDIKPANIMLSRCGGLFDFAKVLDFGLALTRQPHERAITQEGALLGTPHFMAPEQGLGAGHLETSADIYALGCVAYYLLSGQNLFEAASAHELIGKHMSQKPIPLDQWVPDVDPDLAQAVMACLHKLPGDRPTALELAELVSPIALTWTNADAARWWSEHVGDISRVSDPPASRGVTVRLERASMSRAPEAALQERSASDS